MIDRNGRPATATARHDTCLVFYLFVTGPPYLYGKTGLKRAESRDHDGRHVCRHTDRRMFDEPKKMVLMRQQKLRDSNDFDCTYICLSSSRKLYFSVPCVLAIVYVPR